MRTLLLMLICCCTAPVESADPPAKEQASKFAGKWRLVEFTRGAEPLEGVVKLELIFDFAAERVTITSLANKDFPTINRLTKISADSDPPLLDLAENTADFDTGKNVFEGICRLDGDTLVWAYNQAGLLGPSFGKRPADFDGTKNSDLITLKLTREK